MSSEALRICHNCGLTVESGILPAIREWNCPGEGCSATIFAMRTRHAMASRAHYKNGLPGSGQREVSSRCIMRFNG